jgi:hypothetical protein
VSADFAAVFVALYVGHGVADHWVQTNWQAANKGRRDWTGRAACLAHVSSYVITQAVALGVLFSVTDRPMLHSWWPVLGLAVSGVTHYWADRRFTLAALCDRWPGGKGDFYRLGQPRKIEAVAHGVAGGDPDTGVVHLWQHGQRDEVPHDNPCLGTGAYVLDQWWHIGWLFVAALIIAAGAA